MLTTMNGSFIQPASSTMEAPALSPSLQVRLHHRKRGQLVAEWCFDRAFRIGGDAACDVCLDDPSVRARHAEVYLDGAVWRIRDLEEGHNTLVNGAPLHDGKDGTPRQDVRLSNPSTLQLGLYGPVLHLTIEPLAATATNKDITDAAPTEPTTIGRSTSPPAPAPLSELTRPPEVFRFDLSRRPTAAMSSETSQTSPSTIAPSKPDKPASLPADTPRYQGHGFTMPLPEDWHDQTLYTLAGPMADDIRHAVLVEVDPAPPTKDLEAYADTHLTFLQNDLEGFRLVRRDAKTTACNEKALRVIYGWRPNGSRILFQAQLFVLHQGKGYKLTTSFTNASRKQVGQEIEAVMLGFTPTLA